jgi:hypothetical protein
VTDAREFQYILNVYFIHFFFPASPAPRAARCRPSVAHAFVSLFFLNPSHSSDIKARAAMDGGAPLG